MDCPDQNIDGLDLALFGDDPLLENASKKCTKVVAVDVDSREGSTGGFNDMLRRGFVMKWIASDCISCEESGGRCGFDNSTYHFNCFCPDRPHSSSCPGMFVYFLPLR